MGNRHSRTVRYSAPDSGTRKSFWRQRGRLSAPCERTFISPDDLRPPMPTTSSQRATHRSTVTSTPLQIRVTNLRQNEKLEFPLVLIEGNVENLGPANLSDNALYLQSVAHAVEQGGSLNNSWIGSVCWPVVRESGHFKAYVHLPHPGVFNIRLQIASAVHLLTVRFAPRRTKWIVRFHYQKPRDSYEGFDAPNGVDNSDSDACERVKFNAMVLQTTVAELFHRAGFSRKTFAMEHEADGFPIVDVLRSNHSTNQARRMTDSQLLKHLNEDAQAADKLKQQECGASSKRYRVKHVVLLGGSHFDPRTQKLSNYRALVGGDVIATSVCGMFTWPRRLNELTACCFNSNSIVSELARDACSTRQNYWAYYGGGISILLHLLGLSFGLKYRAVGVMHKNFRQATRLLTVMEPRTGKQQLRTLGRPIGDGRFDKLQRHALKPVGEASDAVCLDDVSICELAINCRWINPTSKKHLHAAKEKPATAA